MLIHKGYVRLQKDLSKLELARLTLRMVNKAWLS